ADLLHHVLEVPRLVALGAGERVAVHRVAGPHDRVPGGADGGHERRKAIAHALRAHPGDEGEPPGGAVRVEPLTHGEGVVESRFRAELHADGIVDPGEELDVRTVWLAGPLSRPQEMSRAVVPVAAQAVLTGEGLLPAEEERFVG